MFKVGDKVVCVDDTPIYNNECLGITENRVYTIKIIELGLIKIFGDYMHYSQTRFVSLQSYRRIKLKELMKCSE